MSGRVTLINPRCPTPSIQRLRPLVGNLAIFIDASTRCPAPPYSVPDPSLLSATTAPHPWKAAAPRSTEVNSASSAESHNYGDENTT
ncbi:hypothetical protein B0H12DRAFT_525020 [Mycena haematopus]|nr:hypothetical protein B0H12DRAFT_525020 [Mycena haematopus]